MIHSIKLAFPAAIILAMGCSGVKVETETRVPPDQISLGKSYFLRVQTGDPQLDSFLYEYCFHEVGRFLDLSEKAETANGTVDILFTTVGHNKTVSSGAGISSASGWYTGSGSVAASGLGSSFSTTETKTKQWSTMVVSIKSVEGKRLWWADLDLTGKGSVKTSSGAARYLAKRLSSVMEDSHFKALPSTK